MHVRSLKPHTLILSIAIFIISLVSLFASTVTNAAPNAQINYQGKLTNSSNIAVADGTYNMRFWLLTTPTIATTSAVWTESLTTTNRVQVTNGLFSVMLGSTSPLTSVDFNQTLYLGVEIGSTTTTPVWDGEMSPRKILGTVPAAFEADRLDGLTSSQFVRTDAPSTIASSSPLTLLTITQNGAGDIFNIFDGASEVFTVIDGGFVGVGSTTPSRLFTVNGDMYAANITATGTIATANLTATNATITNATSTTFRTGTLGVGSDYITDITGSGLSLSNGTLSALGDGVSHWLYNGSRLSPSTTVGVGIFASSTIGGGTGATGLTIAGTATTTNLKVTSLTASRALFTGADNLLTTTGVSQYLIDSLSDETGTGSLVFSASPTFTGGATFAGIRVTASSTLAYASSTALTVSGQTYLGYASSTGVSGTNANFTNGYFTFASTTNASTTGLTAQRAYLTTLSILGQTAGVLTTSSSGVVAASTTIGDGYVTDALTLSGGTISSNSISGTLTTTGALTIGDGGDALTIDSSGWDVANSIMTGLSGLVVTGSSTLGYASSTALTVSGNTILANATSTHLFATNASTSNFYGAGLTSCTGSSNKVTWSNGRFICDTDQAGSGADGVSDWRQAIAGVLSPSTTVGISVSASSTIGGGTGATGLTINGTATTTNLKVTSLTASRALFTGADNLLTTTGVSQYLIDSLSDETGTGSLVFSTNPLLAGFRSNASSTIGGGTGASGLTISGGATTTGNAYFGGNLMVSGSGSTIDLRGDTGNETLSVLNTSVGTYTFSANAQGIVNINATSAFSSVTAFNINQNGAGTAWIPMRVTSGGGPSGDIFVINSADENNNVGIGTSSPSAKLTVHARVGETNTRLFTIASSSGSTGTSTIMTVLAGGNVGIGTSTPTALLALTGSANQTSPMLRISSSTEAILFEVAWDGSVNIDGGGFSYNAGTNETSIEQLLLGAVNFETDAGVVSWVDMQSSSTPAGEPLSYSAQIDGNNILTVFGQSNGSGGVQNLRVGIGTTSPWKTLSVSGDLSLTGAIFDTASTSGTNGMVLQTTGTSTRWVATSTLGLSSGSGADGVSDWRQAVAGVLSPSTTVGISVSASSTIGGGTGATGLTINGTATTTNLKVTSLTAARGIFTAADGLLTTSGVSQYLIDSLSDETGTGSLVFSTNPLLAGFRSNASSTIGNGTGAGGLTINGGATTTYGMSLGSSLTNHANLLKFTNTNLTNPSFTAADLQYTVTPATNPAMVGINLSQRILGSATGGSVKGVYSSITPNGTFGVQTIPTIVGFDSYVSDGSSAFMNDTYHFRAQSDIGDTGSGGPAENVYGFYSGYLGHRSGGGNVTNYGLYIDDTSWDASTVARDYGVYVVSAKSYFGADVSIGTATPFARLAIQNNYGSRQALFDIATTTSSTYATSSLFRVTHAGYVGIGSSTPSRLLTVAGDIYGANITATGTASSSALVASNSIDLFGGGAKTTANALCLQLTGSVDLCDGSDGGGGAGELSDWQQTIAGVLSPSTTVGISVSASSTIGGGTGASGLTILGNATTTGSLIVQGTATSTFANDIMLTNGCFRDASGKCIGNGRDGTYIVAAYNSTNRAYADYVADGTGDETEINAAITAAYANGRGGKVYLLEGDFTMSTGQGDKIIMATSTALIGAGMGTRLHVANATDANLNVIVASSTPHITIADLFIDGNRYNNTATIQYGVYFSNVSSSTIENVTASGTRRHGIQIDGGSGLRIVNNAVINNGSRGISTNAVSSSLFANNILSSNTANGIVVSGGNYNTLTGNIANRNGDIGMYIFGTNHNTISGNQASLNTNHGINLEGSDDNTVSGNTTNGNSRGLFITSASDRNTITGNTSNSNSAYGVLLSSTAVLNTVTGNSLYGNFTGIEVGSASFRNVISSNVVDTSGTHGIYLNTVDDNTVTGNIVRSSSNHGIYLTSSDNNIIDSNRVSFSGSTYNQIYLENGSNGNLVSSNLINDTSGTGFAIMTSSNSSNNSLVGNVYSGQGASAINDTATGTTKYTQNDRLTVTMNNQVAWSPLYIAASTTGSSTIHVVQSGTGPLMSFFTATSGKLFTIENNGFVGIGTSTPTALLALTGSINQTSPMLRISSSTEAVLFEVAWDGSVNIDGGGFSYNAGTNETTIEQLMLGAVNFETDAGVVSWVDMQSSSTPSGDTLSYSAQIDGNPVLTVFGQSNGSGGVQNLRVGIGTTSPWKTLSVSGDISLTGAIFDTASTSGTNGQYLMSTGTSTRWSTVTASGDGVSDWRQAIAGVLSPSTTVGISVSASSTIGGGTGATGLTINGTATTTGLVVSNSIELFGGGVKTTANELCLQLTGSAALCDGSDDGGGGSGELSDWQLGGVGYITPSTTVGIIVSASSTIGGGTGASGLTISGGATTTGNAYFAGSVAIGTTTPSATLALTGSGQTNLFQFASSTGSSLLTLDSRGRLMFGTSTAKSSAGANIFINGGPTSTYPYTLGSNIAIGNDAFSYASSTALSSLNIAIGSGALRGSSTMQNRSLRNIAIGADTLGNLARGTDNTALGDSALYKITYSTGNTAIGSSAIGSSGDFAIGNYNTAVGSNAMYLSASTTAEGNSALGRSALNQNSGSYNSGLGFESVGGSGSGNSGWYNVGFGYQALGVNRTGANNTAIGTFALLSNTHGSGTVAIGYRALGSNTIGASSTALGAFAGNTNTTGKSNLYLGDEADSISNALNYAVAIGSHSLVARSNTLVLGGTGAYTTDIVTGTSTPFAKFSIQNNYGSTTPLFDIATTTSSAYATSSLFRVNYDGRVSIGSTTPESLLLTLQKTGISGSGIAGIKEYLQFTNSTANAVYYGDNAYIVNAPTATSTLVGKIIRIEDNSQLGNTVRGLEVQAHRGTTTKGENTAISGFGRTFGVRGTTEGDAGDTFIPAGVYAESRGTTQGNALRAYSGSITTSNLAYLFHDTSVFSGTGLLMNFGNAGGSFAPTSSAKFLDFQSGGTSKFTVTAAGTTTIGDGTTARMAGLQIGFGGLCVDNDGSCAASTTGRITAVQYGTANSDLAEMYFSNEDLLPGEIVALDGGLSITRAEHEDTNLIVGVVSTKPGITMGFDDKPMNTGEEAYPVALKGRVPVRLSTENGPITKGDRITISSIEGVGMKAKESSVVVGIALEDYDGEHAYTEGFINQFGDDIAKAKTRPINQNMDTRTQDGCSYGAGNEEGEETCVKDVVKAIKVTTVTPPSYEEALQELEDEEATTTTLENGEEVKVGQALMFVQLAQYTMDAEVDILALLNSTSTLENGNGEETLFDRLKELAEGFVDGVLTLAEVVADKFTAEEVQTEMLCIGDTCVDESTLRALLRSQGQSSVENPTEPDPEPIDDGEETPPNDDAEDTTPPEDGGVGGGSDETEPPTDPIEGPGGEEGDTDPEPTVDEAVPPAPESPTEPAV